MQAKEKNSNELEKMKWYVRDVYTMINGRSLLAPSSIAVDRYMFKARESYLRTCQTRRPLSHLTS